MKRKIAATLRRLADRINRPTPVYPEIGPQVVATQKQTEAIREMTGVLKNQQSVGEVLQGVAVGIVGPQIVRAVNDTRTLGTSDSEILDTLVERLTDGWF